MQDQKEALRKRARLLEYITIIWNICEGGGALFAGVLAGSISLIAFGLSSGLEVFAGAVVLWEINHKDRSKEKKALMLIGTGYFLLAGYIVWFGIKELINQHHSRPSLFGIFLLLATVVVMFTLAFLKKSTGKKMSSETVLAEANYSYIDGSLAAAVVTGLALNVLFGWWWSDELLALFIACFAVKEGISNLPCNPFL